VPREGVPTVEGIRPGDRAVGGSNLYHDVKTLNVFRMLTTITKNPTYEKAVNDYTAYFLKNTQNSNTGLLGWREHLYYDLFTDSVNIEEKYKVAEYGGYWHELLGYAPPWESFWKIDSGRTSGAIAGIRYHFFEPDSKTYLFNRLLHGIKPIINPAPQRNPESSIQACMPMPLCFCTIKPAKKNGSGGQKASDHYTGTTGILQQILLWVVSAIRGQQASIPLSAEQRFYRTFY